MRNGMKVATLVMALILVFGAVIGGTVAWLITNTAPVINTFTYGDINIKLEETDTGLDGDNDPTTNKYQMVPGEDITKNPTVTVLANSEDCYLFVKLNKSANFDEFMTYNVILEDDPATAVDEKWTLLPGTDNIYYKEVSRSADNQVFGVLVDNKVTVKADVTKAQLNALDAGGVINYPTMTVTAYAVQKAGIATPADAWACITAEYPQTNTP